MNANEVYKLPTLTRCAKRYKKVPVDPPATGHRSVEDGWLSAEIHISIDVDKLSRHIAKSIGNKNNKSILACGAIIIQSKNVKERIDRPNAKAVILS